MLDQVKKSVLGRLASRYAEANIGLYATVVAYNALFSIFPITLALLYIISRLVPDIGSLGQITGIIGALLPSDAAAQIDQVLKSTRQGAGLAGLIALIALIWAGSGLFGSLANAFNRIYGIPDRPFVREKVMAMGMILVFAILFALSILLSSAAQFLLAFASLFPSDALVTMAPLATAASFFLSLVAAFALFLIVYAIVPNARLGIADVWPGALLGSVLFLILAQAFPLYVRLFGNFDRYGAFFGFAFLLLTWLYFMAQVILVGATLNAVLSPQKEPRAT